MPLPSIRFTYTWATADETAPTATMVERSAQTDTTWARIQYIHVEVDAETGALDFSAYGKRLTNSGQIDQRQGASSLCWDQTLQADVVDGLVADIRERLA